ncbi:MAG: N utilization substance protein B, partial [Acidobacteria bacterium]|nr:N utilization substance protein B [Acidobacteriota bacterium]
MTAGRRRTAREMAVQMLYQSDLGGSPLPHIFATFDVADYLGGDLGRHKRRIEDAFAYAQTLVRGTVD